MLGANDNEDCIPLVERDVAANKIKIVASVENIQETETATNTGSDRSSVELQGEAGGARGGREDREEEAAGGGRGKDRQRKIGVCNPIPLSQVLGS